MTITLHPRGPFSLTAAATFVGRHRAWVAPLLRTWREAETNESHPYKHARGGLGFHHSI